MVKDRTSNEEHLLSRRTGPAHARAGETELELLDATLGDARANREAHLAEFLVLHAAPMGTEIAGMVG
jgi:hypothetical protein